MDPASAAATRITGPLKKLQTASQHAGTLAHNLDECTKPAEQPLQPSRILALMRHASQLCRAVEALHPDVSEALYELLSEVNHLSEQFHTAAQREEVLTAKVVQLEEARLELVRKQAADRKRILLCQHAYVLDEVACLVVGGRYKFPAFSLHNVMEAVKEGRLTAQQQQRWERFCSWLRRQDNKWDPYELHEVAMPLRQLRRDTAHGSQAENKSITSSQQLLQMLDAEVSLDAESAAEVRAMMGLLSHFTDDTYPLLVDKEKVQAVLRDGSK